MKNIYLVLFTALFLASCAEQKDASLETILASNDLKQIKAKKSDIDLQQQALTLDLKKINDKLDSLDKDKNVPLITTLKVKEQVFTHFIALQGNVKTKQNVLVYPEMPGILKSVLVKEGQRVKQGQILATIDDGGMSQQLAQLETNVQLAKTTFERQQRLWEQKIGSEIQFLQTKTAFESQKSAVSQLKQQLEKSIVTAPFSGIIDAVFKEKGVVVVAPGQGSEIFRIVNLSNMYIETEVPETYIRSITKNKTVEVNFPILNQTMQSKIRQVGNFINPNNRSFKIEIGVPNLNGNIKPNLTARLKLNDYTNPKAILIPQSIISENAQGAQFVYVVVDKKDQKAIAKRLIIETGKTQGDLIEVVKNLAADAEIIIEGARSVNNGQVVKVINKKE